MTVGGPAPPGMTLRAGTAPAAGDLGAALLAGAVMAATAWAVVSGGWVEGGVGILVVSLAGVVEAAALHLVRAGRIAALAAVPVLLGAAVVPVTIGAMPPDDQEGVSHAAERYLGALAGGLTGGGTWPFAVALCAVLWGCGWWLGWFALRERRGVIGTLPCYTVLAINALNAPSLARVSLPEVLAAGGCVLLLAQVHLARLLGTWSARPVPVLGGVARRFTVSSLLMATAVTALAVALPPVSTRDISPLLFTSRVHPPQPHSGGSGPLPAAVAFSPETSPGGPLVDLHRRAFTYTSDGPPSAYLRLIDDDVLVAGAWFPAGEAPAAVRGPLSERIVAASEGPLPRDRDPGHGGLTQPARTVHLSLTYPASGSPDLPYLPFGGDPDAISGEGSFLVQGLLPASPRAALPATVEAVVPDPPPSGPRGLSTTGLLSTATEAQLRRAGTDYPPFALALARPPEGPEGMTSPIAELARGWTAEAATPYDQAKAIEGHLRDPALFAYDLAPPTPPPGVWPVTFFLASSHRGYCQYFASAMGSMLRSLGIPARLVNGYGPGEVSATGTPGVSRHTISTSDAHTWVEAYFPDHGWVSFEPTPPSSLGDYRPDPRGAPAALPTPTSTPAPGRQSPSPTPSASPAPSRAASTSPPRPGSAGPLLPLVLTSSGLVLTLVALTAWWLNPATLRGLWRRLGLLGLLLRVRRSPAETDAGYAARLAAALPRTGTGLASALAGIAEVSGRAQFSRAGPGAVEGHGWRRSWSEVARSTPAVLRSRLRRSAGSPRGSGGRGRSGRRGGAGAR